MQVKMTERDKKLIVFLAIVVIVVAIGYWGIRPMLKSAKEDRVLIEEQQFMKERSEQKAQMIPLLEEETNAANEEIEVLKEDFYPIMTADELDKMFTSMVLKRNLFAYDLDIEIGEDPVDFEAYQYSDLFINPMDYSETGEKRSEEEEEEENDALLTQKEALEAVEAAAETEVVFDDEEDEVTNTSVYAADISLRLGGSKQQLLKLIDDLAKLDKRVLIKSYSWSENADVVEGNGENLGEDASISSTQTEMTADGEYTVVNRVELNIDLTVFMYKE